MGGRRRGANGLRGSRRAVRRRRIERHRSRPRRSVNNRACRHGGNNRGRIWKAVPGLLGGGDAQPDNMVVVVRNRSVVLVRCDMPMDDGSAVVVIGVMNVLRRGDAQERNGLRNEQ